MMQNSFIFFAINEFWRFCMCQLMTNCFFLYYRWMELLQLEDLAKNKPDVFCYICGEYTIVPNRNQVTSFIKHAYHSYFGIKHGDQDKAWAPHMVCKSCTEYPHQWTKGKKSCLKFGIPMVWREPTNHVTDCYFCTIDVTGINRKN